ncbi:DUF4136 domain-containing protein [Sphingomonas sp. 28-63-12]|uniref:DUF4136 domain-containing protein n=1 Tax=Sphingomonas sp. 28-63-12 TaxID=1970434 RepID=UPI000BDB6401|nr:MAG: lipoprotein transmembrane [Sphingomonas sp. 28-63-12]
MKKSFVAVAAILLLSSCATPFTAKVSRFQMLAPPAGQTFVVQSTDPQLQGGIEFSQYAQLVSARLVQQGYQPAADPSQAQLVVKMHYDVDRGRERVRSTGLGYGGLGFGGFGGYGGGYGGYGYGGFGRHGYIFGWNDPFLFGGGFNDTYSYTVYTSELDLQIERTDNGKRVFEGTAKAQSTNDDLPKIVPNLVDAMFTDFPGNSGETVKITIAPDPKRAK